MAITPIQPVQKRQQQTRTTGGQLGKTLGPALGIAGAIAGGLATGGTGALGGFSAGMGAGQGLGQILDPVKRETVEQQQPSAPQLGVQQVSQKYKMSDNGRIALEGLQVAQADPAYAEYQEPLALAIMQDIAQNNPKVGRA